MSPRIEYLEWKPGVAALETVGAAHAICTEYAAQGYDLTLRQLYYQFVARALIPNNQRSYKRLGDIVNRARLAGFLDWSFIVDRTRNLQSVSHWADPTEIIEACADSFRLDKWEDQPARVEVWVEKEALAGVVQKVADQWDCPWFSCRGYVSQSELWGASRRMERYFRAGAEEVIVLHLGDHDPSGIDMTRDIQDRLELFGVGAVEVKRIALNMDQIEQYGPPPNPTKLTDSRSDGYIHRFGMESWELDALDPATLDKLISDNIQPWIDESLYQGRLDEEQRHRDLLEAASDRWDELVEVLETEED